TLTFLKEDRAERNTRISICGPTSIMRARVTPCLNRFLKHHPRLVLHLEFDDFENRIQKLKSGQSDFALTRATNVPKELESKIMVPDRFLLVGPAQWKKRKLIDIVKNERIIDFD